MPRRTSEESSWVTGRGIGKEVGCVPGCGKTEARADTVKKQCTTPKRTKASYRSVKYVTAVIYGAALKP